MHEDKTYAESEVLASSSVIVVLAEPGAGKTELLNSLARSAGVARVKASIFRHQTSMTNTVCLILDAFDEVAKLDPSGIDAILVKAQETGAKKVIIASRSGEWEEARNRQIKECFGTDPFVVRLTAFDENEQRVLFKHHLIHGDFEAFKAEIDRFDLEPLLGNPQFLKLFIDAYVESGNKFTTKKEIFESAVKRLAYEANTAMVQKNSTTTVERITWASEIYAKLLLSGATGVSMTETVSDRDFPRLAHLLASDKPTESILDTRLFKPSDNPNEHEPVHRIVAEYCAAQYLARRIADSSDPLSLAQCMAVIAPNAVVRDELRGLLAWMASVGDESLQEAAIDLDPYGVLANGDPSQLLNSSKKKLLSRLQTIAHDDPFFRRGDYWRTFSASGFFTKEVVEEVRPLLQGDDDKDFLRGLLLELLNGSTAIPQLLTELRILMLSAGGSKNTRLLAQRCLISIDGYDHLSDAAVLIAEGSDDALNIAAQIFEKTGVDNEARGTFLTLLRSCAELYPKNDNQRELVIGSRYFIKRLIGSLKLSTIVWLLDQLTDGLKCNCGQEKSYNCQCRNGVSKIVGALLDRYFEQTEVSHDPAQIWQWVKNLNFHSGMSADQGTAVKALQTDHTLRQAIQALALGTLTDPDEVWNLRLHYFEQQKHSGLHFQAEDCRVMADFAFETDNPGLWSHFIASHNRHLAKNRRGADELRRHMRGQARAKPEFLAFWMRRNRAATKFERSNRFPTFRHSRRMKRYARTQATMHAENKEYVQANRALVESGRHWGCLSRFATLTLMEPDKIEEEFGDVELVQNALRNCLPFIDQDVPDLHRLAELQCASQSLSTENVIYAACLTIFRFEGNLNSVSEKTLKALKTNLSMGYDAVDSSERDALELEVDRLLFTSVDSILKFAEDYIEPQLSNDLCAHTDVGWLKYKTMFDPVKGQLANNWLTKFSTVKVETLQQLFDVCVQHSDRNQLVALINLRCSDILSKWPEPTDDEILESRRKFWFIRQFCFAESGYDDVWRWLKADKNTIFSLNELSGATSHNDVAGWPKLSAIKVGLILEAFVDQWPKVNLPNSWGTGSPEGETAYRFLTEIIWEIGKDDRGNSLQVLEGLLADHRFMDFHVTLRSLRATARRKEGLRNFEAPTPSEITELLDGGQVVTVEGLRALILAELSVMQEVIRGGEFNTLEVFYDGGKRLNENRATTRIADRLQLQLKSLNMSVAIEHYMKNAKRCDITASKIIGNGRKLVVVEVKGQWHPELFTAAKLQLHERYSIHPDAQQQGIYLVLWFGNGELVAGKTDISISTPVQLREEILKSMPSEIHGLIDVYVLDLSKSEVDLQKKSQKS